MKNVKTKLTNLLIITITSVVIILGAMQVSSYMIEKSSALGKYLGEEGNLYYILNHGYAMADYSVTFKASKADDVEEKLTPEQRLKKEFDNDINFRAYIVNMVVNNNNPGNLKFANQPYATNSNGFASFPDTYTGFRALIKQLELDMARGDTIKTLIEDYAPYEENDTERYISHIEGKVADRNTKLEDVDIIWLAVVMVECEHSIFYN